MSRFAGVRPRPLRPGARRRNPEAAPFAGEGSDWRNGTKQVVEDLWGELETETRGEAYRGLAMR